MFILVKASTCKGIDCSNFLKVYLNNIVMFDVILSGWLVSGGHLRVGAGGGAVRLHGRQVRSGIGGLFRSSRDVKKTLVRWTQNFAISEYK